MSLGKTANFVSGLSGSVSQPTGGGEGVGRHREVQTPNQIWGSLIRFPRTEGEKSCGENASDAGWNHTGETELLLLLRENLLIIPSIYPLNCSKNPAQSKVLHHARANFAHTEFFQLGRSRICAAAFDASITGGAGRRSEAPACLGFGGD